MYALKEQPDCLESNHHNIANKLDSGKAPLGLIPQSALIEEAYVLGFGETKYGRHNWRKGLEWSRLLDAAMRHIIAFNDGENFDPETGLHHLAHARCCLGFLIEYETTHPELDDRYREEQQQPTMRLFINKLLNEGMTIADITTAFIAELKQFKGDGCGE